MTRTYGRNESKNAMKHSYFVNLIERVLDVKLRFAAKGIIDGFAFAFTIGLGVFAISIVGDYFIYDNSFLSSNLIESGIFSLELIAILWLAKVLYTFIPIWLRAVFGEREKLKLFFAGLICSLALVFCVYFSFHSFNQASLKDVSIESELVRQCYVAQSSNCNSDSGKNISSSTSNAQENTDKIDTNEKGPIEDEFSISSFNKLRAEYGIDEFDLTERAEFIEKTFSTLFDGEEVESWEIFLSELDEVASKKPAYIRLMISKAIVKKAPFGVVVEILNRGHDLNGNHVTILATRLNLDELKQLENFGVDITEPSLTGSNMLVSSLFNADRDEMFEYLLSVDELVYSEDIDVVKGVIEASRLLNYDATYARRVVSQGAEISADTRNWIENDLKLKDPSFYLKIKTELGI
ncbi:MAG: hypothetical protein AAF364_06255 [Pseudomonadota bacterium]